MTMKEIQQRDLAESRQGDIRSKFDAGFIPGAHTPRTQLIQGVHGWIDADGTLVPFDPIEVEIAPESLDANIELDTPDERSADERH